MDKSYYTQKLEYMRKGGISKGTYEKTKDFKIFCVETFTVTKTTTRCTHILINQPNYMELLRLTSLKILKK